MERSFQLGTFFSCSLTILIDIFTCHQVNMHGKDQSILAIGKEIVMQPSTLFLLGVKTHFL
jgi:hypothetical protein